MAAPAQIEGGSAIKARPMHENPCVTVGFSIFNRCSKNIRVNCALKKSCFQSESELGTIKDKSGDFTVARNDKSDYEGGVGLNGEGRPC